MRRPRFARWGYLLGFYDCPVAKANGREMSGCFPPTPSHYSMVCPCYYSRFPEDTLSAWLHRYLELGTLLNVTIWQLSSWGKLRSHGDVMTWLRSCHSTMIELEFEPRKPAWKVRVSHWTRHHLLSFFLKSPWRHVITSRVKFKLPSKCTEHFISGPCSFCLPFLHPANLAPCLQIQESSTLSLFANFAYAGALRAPC